LTNAIFISLWVFSITFAASATFIDENFDVKISLEDVNKFNRVSDIISFLGEKIQ